MRSALSGQRGRERYTANHSLASLAGPIGALALIWFAGWGRAGHAAGV